MRLSLKSPVILHQFVRAGFKTITGGMFRKQVYGTGGTFGVLTREVAILTLEFTP
jgi:hypothetical protein